MISDRRTTSRDGFAHDAGDAASRHGDTVGDEPAVSVQAIIADLLAQGATYLSAKRDLFKLRLLSLAITILVGLLALIAAIGVVAASAVLLVLGVAGGVAALFEIPLWAGQLITSTGLVGIGALTLYTVLTYLRYSSFQQTIVKYERRQQPHPAASQHTHVPTGASNG